MNRTRPSFQGIGILNEERLNQLPHKTNLRTAKWKITTEEQRPYAPTWYPSPIVLSSARFTVVSRAEIIFGDRKQILSNSPQSGLTQSKSAERNHIADFSTGDFLPIAVYHSTTYSEDSLPAAPLGSVGVSSYDDHTAR